MQEPWLNALVAAGNLFAAYIIQHDEEMFFRVMFAINIVLAMANLFWVAYWFVGVLILRRAGL